MVIRNSKEKGSITVYLALIFGIVLMFIAAVISLLRYEAEQVNMQRTLDISVESAFGKYFRPLLDDYGLFYYMETDEEALSADVMSYFEKNQRHAHRFLKLTAQSLNTSEKSYAVDNNCANAESQMITAGKYACGQMALDKLINQINKYYGRQEAVNESVNEAVSDIDSIKADAACEEKILKLLSLIDGAVIKGADISKSKHFLKEGLKGKITQGNAGIECSAVFNCIKDECFDISGLLKELKRKSRKGAQGKAVKLPKKKINDWVNRIKNIKNVAEEAYEICDGLDRQMSADLKKQAICNVSDIRQKLLKNISILDDLSKLSDYGDITDKEKWVDYGVYIDSLINSLSGYHVRDISFDYSSYNPKDADDPTESIDMNASGILSLLLGSDKGISSKAVKEAGLYKDLSENDKGGNDKSKEDSKDYRDAESIGNVLSDCIVPGAAENINDLAWLIVYVNSYFDNFLSENKDTDAVKALLYEQEYIIGGKVSDDENLKSVVNRLLLIRTGENFIYFISDKSQCAKAYQTAAALVGFSGMEALVRVTQYIILTGWSYAEACVDVSGLLNGKKISLSKSKSTLNIAYHELHFFGRKLIKEKVAKMDKKKGIGYDKCLWLLMAGKNKKSVFYAMDIIHYNMKLRYYKNFSFHHALYGASFDMTVSSPFYCGCKASFSY